MPDQEIFCERCSQLLDPNEAVWLDMNASTLECRVDPWPEDVSQGAFAFGKRCAKIVLKAGAFQRLDTPKSRIRRY